MSSSSACTVNWRFDLIQQCIYNMLSGSLDSFCPLLFMYVDSTAAQQDRLGVSVKESVTMIVIFPGH